MARYGRRKKARRSKGRAKKYTLAEAKRVLGRGRRSTRRPGRSYSRSVSRKRTTKRTKRAAPRRVEHVLVVQQLGPQVLQPAPAAKPRKHRFGG